MFWLIIILIITGIFIWIYRFYFFSILIYLSVRFERRPKDFQLLSALRENLIHERKKKMAGMEMMLSSWERGDEIQPRYEYFEELLSQLKNLVWEERRNLMAVTKDIFLWGKLWHKLRRVEKMSKEKRERVEIGELRNELNRIQNLIDEVVEDATEQFSFTLNQVVSESVKIVRIEKSHLKNIEIQEHLDEAGDTIRFSYDKFKDWQRILTNLIRNAIEAVEEKKAGDSGLGLVAGEGTVAADFSLRGGEQTYRVKVSTKESEEDGGQAGMPDLQGIEPTSPRRQGSQPCNEVSVIIEDSGIGMDEITRSSFYKKGFTFGKEGGLGLGVSEESVQLINQYGNWQIESQKGVGTKITINIDKEKAQKAELILPEPKPFFRTKLAYSISVLVLALIGLGLMFILDKYSRFWVDWNIDHMEVKKGNLKVFNKKDELLWSKEFTGLISDGVDWLPQSVMADINRDGRKEIIICLFLPDSSRARVICMDFKGNELWNSDCKQKTIYIAEQDIFCPNILLVKDLDRDGNIEIVINNRVSTSFSDYLTILDAKGRKKSEYWHPGLINVLQCRDINKDGKDELICGGINNRMDWRPCFLVLDPRKISGQAMPYVGEKRVPPARELVYILFPHFKIEAGADFSWEHCLDYVHLINIFSVGTDSTIYQVTTSLFSLSWYLDQDFRVKNLAYNLGNINSKLSEMKIPYVVTEDDMKEIRNIEFWKDGVRIR